MTYNTNDLTLDQKRDLCQRAKEVCNHWWVDAVDRKTLARKRIEMPFEEIVTKLDESCDLVIARRTMPPENHVELIYRMNSPAYFLFIELDPEKAKFLLKDIPQRL